IGEQIGTRREPDRLVEIHNRPVVVGLVQIEERTIGEWLGGVGVQARRFAEVPHGEIIGAFPQMRLAETEHVGALLRFRARRRGFAADFRGCGLWLHIWRYRNLRRRLGNGTRRGGRRARTGLWSGFLRRLVRRGRPRAADFGSAGSALPGRLDLCAPCCGVRLPFEGEDRDRENENEGADSRKNESPPSRRRRLGILRNRRAAQWAFLL